VKTIFRIAKQERDFTIVSNATLRDATLSWRARGLLAYLLSLPTDWEVSFTHLEKQASEGRTALRSALGELEAGGYVRRQRLNTDDGQFRWVTFVYERPQMPVEATQSAPDASTVPAATVAPVAAPATSDAPVAAAGNEPDADAAVTATEIRDAFADVVRELPSLHATPTSAFLAGLDLAAEHAEAFAGVSPDIAGVLRNSVLTEAVRYAFDDFPDRDLPRLFKAAKLGGDDHARHLIGAIFIAATAALDGSPASYIIRTATNRASAQKAA
jgi:hypothetical protein